MRVVQAMTGGPGHYGAEKMYVSLVLALHEAGVEQIAAIRRHPTRVPELRQGGVHVKEMHFGGNRLWFWSLIWRTSPDILMTWKGRATECSPPGRHIHLGRLDGYYNLKHYRRCNYLVCVSKNVVDHVIDNGWPANRVHYIPNFVDERTAPAVSRKQFETPEDVPLVVAVGRFHPEKGFDVLIDAMARLPEVWLWIAGHGNEGANLKRQAEERGVAERLRFLGYRDDVPAILAAADCLAVPSRSEPLGCVLLEGWVHGVPVVSTRSGGGVELLANGAGLLTPVDDSEALADAISTVLSDRELAAALVRTGSARYWEEFSREKVVAQYLELFDRITG